MKKCLRQNLTHLPIELHGFRADFLPPTIKEQSERPLFSALDSASIKNYFEKGIQCPAESHGVFGGHSR
jgi:hypothetical protein